MRNLLIDTNIYVAFKRGSSEVQKVFQHTDHIGIDSCVLAELYSGFRLGNRNKKNVEELEDFLRTPRVSIYNHTLKTAEFYAHVYERLRRQGTPIPSNDIWIAAVAMEQGLALYSYDRHFDHVDGMVRYAV